MRAKWIGLTLLGALVACLIISLTTWQVGAYKESKEPSDVVLIEGVTNTYEAFKDSVGPLAKKPVDDVGEIIDGQVLEAEDCIAMSNGSALQWVICRDKNYSSPYPSFQDAIDALGVDLGSVQPTVVSMGNTECYRLASLFWGSGSKFIHLSSGSCPGVGINDLGIYGWANVASSAYGGTCCLQMWSLPGQGGSTYTATPSHGRLSDVDFNNKADSTEA